MWRALSRRVVPATVLIYGMVCCHSRWDYDKQSYGTMGRPRGFYDSWLVPFQKGRDSDFIANRVTQVYSDLYLLESGIEMYINENASYAPLPDWLVDEPSTEIRKAWIYSSAVHFLGTAIEEEDVGNNIDALIFTLHKQKLVMDRFKSILPYVNEPIDICGRPNPRTLDPFTHYKRSYGYSTQVKSGEYQLFGYIIRSVGPDGDEDVDLTSYVVFPRPVQWDGKDWKDLMTLQYDPTNGIVSNGDIFILYDRFYRPRDWKN